MMMAQATINPVETEANYEQFRDCLTTVLIKRISQPNNNNNNTTSNKSIKPRKRWSRKTTISSGSETDTGTGPAPDERRRLRLFHHPRTRRRRISCDIRNHHHHSRRGRDSLDQSHLTHHLIPRMVHAKSRKRGGGIAQMKLQNVAWLCRACHSFVHHFANHEDLARKYYTADLLLEQKEIRDFAGWVGRLRWKGA
ncbi:hypothetical protein QBC46DRAFT_381040 [Diplogelasinospora grovesii]|uniref:HNH domain-containing protein n=1 Tax=Diplogelasinospora grovesii TaxID=303347 RepID=A0AAN6NC49_9PEZI|nr:hypothetical protein QBC46DRAFT_381040 [Diplogelasinospora grovesii]